MAAGTGHAARSAKGFQPFGLGFKVRQRCRPVGLDEQRPGIARNLECLVNAPAADDTSPGRVAPKAGSAFQLPDDRAQRVRPSA